MTIYWINGVSLDTKGFQSLTGYKIVNIGPYPKNLTFVSIANYIFYIKWQHVAVIMGRKEHSRQRFFLNCLQAGCNKKEQGWPSPSTTSSDLCSGLQLVSRFMTSFLLLSIWLPGSKVRNSQSCCCRCSTHPSFVSRQRLFGRPECLSLNTAENFFRALYN